MRVEYRDGKSAFTVETFVTLARRVWPRDYDNARTAMALDGTINIGAWANLELGVSIARGSVFPVASVSKQFTAMSILLLAERGQLSLDDEVRTYVPERADHENHIATRCHVHRCDT